MEKNKVCSLTGNWSCLARLCLTKACKNEWRKPITHTHTHTHLISWQRTPLMIYSRSFLNQPFMVVPSIGPFKEVVHFETIKMTLFHQRGNIGYERNWSILERDWFVEGIDLGGFTVFPQKCIVCIAWWLSAWFLLFNRTVRQSYSGQYLNNTYQPSCPPPPQNVHVTSPLSEKLIKVMVSTLTA